MGSGGLLDHVLASVAAGNGGQAALDGFLAALGRARGHHTITEATSPAPRTALIATGDAESVRKLTGDQTAGDHAAVALHCAADPAVWERMVRVGCLIAGAQPDGAASVNALRAALSDHHGGPFTWTPRPPGPP